MAEPEGTGGQARQELPVGATPRLDELLELAAKSHSMRIGSGTLVGECLDTHHPHLPRRVFVRVRDSEGTPVMAWLPTLAQLRIRAGHRVLISKPENWPEPVVTGVIAGLERPSEDGGPSQAQVPVAGDPSSDTPPEPELRLAQGERLLIRGPDGTVLMRIAATAAGPEFTLLGPDANFELPGRLRIGAEQIELHAGAGGVDIRTEGDTVVRARFIRLN